MRKEIKIATSVLLALIAVELVLFVYLFVERGGEQLALDLRHEIGSLVEKTGLIYEDDDAEERRAGEAALSSINDDEYGNPDEFFQIDENDPPGTEPTSPWMDIGYPAPEDSQYIEETLSPEEALARGTPIADIIWPTDEIPPEYEDQVTSDNFPWNQDGDTAYPAPGSASSGMGENQWNSGYPAPENPTYTPVPSISADTPTPPPPTTAPPAPTATLTPLAEPAATQPPAASPTLTPTQAVVLTEPAATQAAEATLPVAATHTPTIMPADENQPTAVTETPDYNPAAPVYTPTPTIQAAAPTLTANIPADFLSAVPVAGSPPQLDGLNSDTTWAAAPEYTVVTTGGANASATRVTLKAAYDKDRVYFLLTWADPTNSFLINPWEKLPDGSWKKQIGADNAGGDENVFYEDKLALYWPINSIPDFNTRGCFTACHTGDSTAAKPYGSKFTSESGQKIDAWIWKSVRGAGQADDQYLDNTPYSTKSPQAGRKADPRTGGGYRANQSEESKIPAFMLPGGGDRTGAPGFIADSAKIPFEDGLFKPGDRLPSIITAPFEGDRGDINAGWRYDKGIWTLEISRKRVTGSAYDVQFSDLSQTYFFGLATFDNTQIRHAYHEAAIALRFKP
jgi:hypothetical protein